MRIIKKVRLRLVLLVMVVFMLTIGCGSLRKGIIKISEEEVKNMEMGREVAENYLEIWPMQSGLIRGALGDNLSQLPASAINAMDELDALAAKIKVDELDAEVSTYTDQELGYSLGLRIRMLNDAVAKALEIFAPDLLSVLGLFVG